MNAMTPINGLVGQMSRLEVGPLTSTPPREATPFDRQLEVIERDNLVREQIWQEHLELAWADAFAAGKRQGERLGATIVLVASVVIFAGYLLLVERGAALGL